MATDVSTSFPDVDLAPGATITVSLSDTGGRITKLNIYGRSPVAEDDTELGITAPLFTYSENPAA